MYIYIHRCISYSHPPLHAWGGQSMRNPCAIHARSMRAIRCCDTGYLTKYNGLLRWHRTTRNRPGWGGSRPPGPMVSVRFSKGFGTVFIWFGGFPTGFRMVLIWCSWDWRYGFTPPFWCCFMIVFLVWLRMGFGMVLVWLSQSKPHTRTNGNGPHLSV